MPGQLVVDRRGIIHSVHDGDVLVVIEVFAELFEAAVEVADVGGDADDPLAVEFQYESEGGVGGGMLRAEVEGPSLAALGVLSRREQVAGGFSEGVGHDRLSK